MTRRQCQSIESTRSPKQVIADWPDDSPLVVLHSGRLHPRWARWTYIAKPAGFYRFTDHSQWSGPGHFDFSHDPLADLRVILSDRKTTRESPKTDFPTSGWIGSLGYELGSVIEPAANPNRNTQDSARSTQHAPPNTLLPLIELARCEGSLVFDHLQQQWSVVGEVEEPLLDILRAHRDVEPPEHFTITDIHSNTPPEQYRALVERTLKYIRAGDIFQANITQQLCGQFAGSTRSLALRAFARSEPWYGAYLEFPGDRCIVSLSPELFLDFDPNSRSILTRPIKGTRPGSSDPAELEHSEKDTAELNMIVDLMRNDLGRVSEIGSVRVSRSRTIESHPTVHHGVAEVCGVLRAGLDRVALLEATFPGGSVTGAPKIRAMQIINELERGQRGGYCGSIGFFGDSGAMRLNIAIRTIELTGRREPGRFDRLDGKLHYGVGGGIVADSNPQAEYQECLDKAAVLRAIARFAHGARMDSYRCHSAVR